MSTRDLPWEVKVAGGRADNLITFKNPGLLNLLELLGPI
jgi:hypothetical protein